MRTTILISGMRSGRVEGFLVGVRDVGQLPPDRHHEQAGSHEGEPKGRRDAQVRTMTPPSPWPSTIPPETPIA
jgi:hypothetical protein